MFMHVSKRNSMIYVVDVNWLFFFCFLSFYRVCSLFLLFRSTAWEPRMLSQLVMSQSQMPRPLTLLSQVVKLVTLISSHHSAPRKKLQISKPLPTNEASLPPTMCEQSKLLGKRKGMCVSGQRDKWHLMLWDGGGTGDGTMHTPPPIPWTSN